MQTVNSNSCANFKRTSVSYPSIDPCAANSPRATNGSPGFVGPKENTGGPFSAQTSIMLILPKRGVGWEKNRKRRHRLGIFAREHRCLWPGGGRNFRPAA